MGISAYYLSVPTSLKAELLQLNQNDLLKRLEELKQIKSDSNYCMGKLWDGLHFLLTGLSANTPIERNPFSEAIVGVHVLDMEKFISFTSPRELEPIVYQLQKISINELNLKFNPLKFHRKNIYPDIWKSYDQEELFYELIDKLRELVVFYQSCLEKQETVFVYIC